LPSEADKKIYYFECNKNGVIIKSPSILHLSAEYTNKYRIVNIKEAAKNSIERAKQFDMEDELENKVEIIRNREKNPSLETALGLIREAIRLIDDPVYYKRSGVTVDGSPILTVSNSKEQILQLLFNVEKHIKKGMERGV
jgi:hypothetical protein